MMHYRIIFFLVIFKALAIDLVAQRIYKSNSVLSNGVWYKVAVKEKGIYKIDVSFLAALGFNTSGLASSSIRVFGNGGAMLSESNAVIPPDDLQETALQMEDGGDGLFNASDYFLFYAAGPHRWLKDSVNRIFTHQKNIYSDSSYFFITTGGIGKRIPVSTFNAPPTVTVNSFNERIFHELDTVNLLSSGKEWVGEEFTDAPGKTLTRNFQFSIPGLVTSFPATLISNCVARSINVASRFDVRIGNQVVQQVNIPSTGAGLYDLFVHQSHIASPVLPGNENIQLNFSYVPGSFNSQGWLNYFELHARRNLTIPGTGQLFFRDWNSVTSNSVCEFRIASASSVTQVWEITEGGSPIKMQGQVTGSELRFVNDGSRLREYVVFNPSGVLLPVNAGKVQNQDLHGLAAADYLIVTHSSLLSQANRLAAFHQQKNNLRTAVVSAEQVFNEFASGTPDPVALRDFVKMFYDRNAGNTSNRPRYLLLFGDASFDYKNRIAINTNLVPAYQSNISFDPLSTYTSDDFFGFLDDNEDINSGLVTNLLDIGIGRVPAKNLEEAKNFVDKVIAYYDKESFGAWRNVITFIADDEDNNLHLQDAELVSSTAASVNPVMNIQKIYLDAYAQQTGAGGSRYPAVNETINNRILNGVLMMNFIGHGGAARLAEEVIVDQSSINNWNNPKRLPLFITATCDVAPYDNPFIHSIGENILLRPKTGGIALMTTTRLVFSFSNRVMNNNYMQFVLQPDANGRYKSLGEAVRETKNFTYLNSGDLINNRKFTLLGDPALTLAFPSLKIKTTRVNLSDPSLQADTISAGEKVVIEGEIRDMNDNLQTGFNGTVQPVVYDKIQILNTLANDPGSLPASFQQYASVLYKGKTSVSGGKFRFEFKVPRDINFQMGRGRISYYAEDGTKDGSENFERLVIGGSAGISDADKEGPVIRAWLNDEKFVNGSIVNSSPVLLLKLSDTSGINISGAGIGHEITAVLDNNYSRQFNLTEYFEAELDKYGSGVIRFQLPLLEPGYHNLRIKAWDVLNNSSDYLLEFLVVKDEELVISRVLNYPNPFTTKTQFWFEHNKPGQDLFVQIHIYSPAGRVIKRIEKTINTTGNRSCELEWDGRDDFGDKVGRGVYLYRLKVNLGSRSRTVVEKMVIL